ncbi:MAG: HlyD family efflux transporter periplasmic adaptor subunit, partial [Bacteroidota bacterium]
RAPFAGLVQSETIAVGDVVTVGQPFAQLIASRAVEAVVPLSDEEAALVPDLFSGRPVEASVYTDFGGLRYRWRATVDRVEATRDAAARTLNVVLSVPAPIAGGRVVDPGEGERSTAPTVVPSAPPPLLPGTYVEAEIRGAELDRYVVVPRRALRRDNEVWAVEQDTLLRVVRVDVLQQVGEQVFVQGAIDAGTPVVTNTLDGVVDGMTVRLARQQGRPPRGGEASEGGQQAANVARPNRSGADR